MRDGMMINLLVALLVVPVPDLELQATRPLRSTVQFYGPDQNANALREYTTAFVRTFVEERGRRFTITSGHRSNSTAHADGALDYRSNDVSGNERHGEAQSLSLGLGSN